MNFEIWVFVACTLGLMITELALFFAVRSLTKKIKMLNDNTQLYFEELQKKVKGLVDLFIASKTVELRRKRK